MKKIIITFISMFFAILIFAQDGSPSITTATAGTLTVSATVTSSTYITAIWINNSTPTFLRTLAVNGQENRYNNELVKWTADCGGTRNYVNAVTGATKSSAAVISATWNGTDQANSTVVADGNYIVKIEMTNESFGTGSKLVTGTFTKGPTAQTVNPANVSPISSISIKWAPVTTAVNEVNLDKLYTIYPNPFISSIYVTGSDIHEVEICSLTGESILVSKEQKVNVSNLPQGAYLAIVRAKNGTVVKKIVKE